MSEPLVASSDPFAPAPCRPWMGRPSEWQSEAKTVVMDRLDRSLPWVHFVADCGTKLCLTDDHLRFFRAQRIQYPTGVCVYCGMPGFTKDHLLPVTATGEAQRKFVAVVPACGECNYGLGDRCGHRVTERREEAHRLIRKKHAKVLNTPPWSPKALAELGPNLRTHIERSISQREVVLERLAWPWDPEYDRRAFEKSGFDDPIGMELL